MARTFTVAELANKVRVRGHFGQSSFITDAMLIDITLGVYLVLLLLVVLRRLLRWADG